HRRPSAFPYTPLFRSARLEGPPHAREVSGIVPSRQWPGVFWVHNDSGDETRIYPIRLDGSLFASARSADAPGVLIGGVVNSDWEDRKSTRLNSSHVKI